MNEPSLTKQAIFRFNSYRAHGVVSCPAMSFYQSETIAADAETVWAVLADPATQAQWHSSFVAIERSRQGPVTLHERFKLTRNMGKEPLSTDAEVIALERPTRVTCRFTAKTHMGTQILEESFELTPRGTGVKVQMRIDLSQARLPWWARVLVWVLSRFGEPEGEGALQGLKRFVEKQESARTLHKVAP